MKNVSRGNPKVCQSPTNWGPIFRDAPIIQGSTPCGRTCCVLLSVRGYHSGDGLPLVTHTTSSKPSVSTCFSDQCLGHYFHFWFNYIVQVSPMCSRGEGRPLISLIYGPEKLHSHAIVHAHGFSITSAPSRAK